MKSGACPLGDEFIRENFLDDYEQKTVIMPGGETHGKRYPFIVDALGLLLANKQIHEEANATLFGKNIFFVAVEWERVHPFWRCENKLCNPNVPCFITFHNFKKIKHLYIVVMNTRGVDDPMLRVESTRLEANLKTVVRCLLHGGNKLSTLKIRYTSCFEGQIDSVRADLEEPLPEGMPKRQVGLKDKHGTNYFVWPEQAEECLFKHCGILDPLLHLSGVAEDVKVRGDLPQDYIDKQVKVLSVSTPAPLTKKKQTKEEAERKKRQRQRKTTGFHACMKELADKHESSDPSMAKFYRDALKAPVMSPALIHDLFKPPTQDELRLMHGGVREQSNGEPTQAVAGLQGPSTSAVASSTSRGIGMLHGKPVYGPPRPALD